MSHQKDAGLKVSFHSAVDDSLKLACLGAFKMSGLGPFSKTHVSDLKRKRGVRTNGWVAKFASLREREHVGCGFIKKGCSETSERISIYTVY